MPEGTVTEIVTIPVTLEIPKETKEVIDALDVILEAAMSGRGATAFVTTFDELMKAADGAAQIKGEMKSQYRDEAAGYLVRTILGRLYPADESVEQPASG